MIPFIAKTLFCTTHIFLSYQPQEIYPLLCPVREYEWIETWNCDMIRSQSGVNEKGCIFRTNFPGLGGPEIWVTSVFEPAERLEFVKTSPCVASILQITLSPENNGTHLTWTQTMTALNEDGNRISKTTTPRISKTSSSSGQPSSTSIFPITRKMEATQPRNVYHRQTSPEIRHSPKHLAVLRPQGTVASAQPHQG
jgi:hypothetical protein